MISAICYMHSEKIMHRDLKPANILFKDDIAKIADYGFS
jgi:serine/threonine protein kinase